MKKIPVILDGDPGHDDAIAWVFAKASPMLDIIAVSSVAGNQTLQKTTYNARRICALLGIDAPFAVGAKKPLINELATAGNWHGESGLDGPAMPEPDREPVDLPVCDLWAKVIRESKDPVTIIATGPLTNVADFLTAHAELKGKIERISIMGGGIEHGNWVPAAEFNIWEDPEAAWIVFHAGIPMFMAGLDVTERAIIKPSDFPAIRGVGNQAADIVTGWLEFFYKYPMAIGYEGAPVHDPCAVLALIHPEIFEMRDLHVEIELEGEYTRGRTVGDLRGGSDVKPNVTCLMNIDRERYVELLCEYLHFYDGRVVKV